MVSEGIFTRKNPFLRYTLIKTSKFLIHSPQIFGSEGPIYIEFEQQRGQYLVHALSIAHVGVGTRPEEQHTNLEHDEIRKKILLKTTKIINSFVSN